MAKTEEGGKELSHFRQHCDLRVPSLMISDEKMTADMWTESQAAYRLVYELILPFLLPMLMLGELHFSTMPSKMFTSVHLRQERRSQSVHNCTAKN